MHLAPPNIYDLIDEFATEKYKRKPWEAGAQRSLLRRFAESARLQTVTDIKEEHVAFFAGQELSEFYTERALLALRQFLWYCRKGGNRCLAHNAASKAHLQKFERPEIVAAPIPSWNISPLWKDEKAELPTGK